MNPIVDFFRADMALSTRTTIVADCLALLGVVAALMASFLRWRALRANRIPHALVRRAPVAFLTAVCATMVVVVFQRWNEVNHFPSQTMSEVLTMFTTALVVQMLVLHFALGLQRRAGKWPILDDMLIALVLLSSVGVHAYVQTLSTAQRDLPPALQSYWFPFHLTALILSYGTMGIAALVCTLYFATRFWSGIFTGGQSFLSQTLILAGFTLIPFVHVVTLPILLVSGVTFAIVWKLGHMPDRFALAKLEKDYEDVSFRTFAVGFPFLTAGLWMGAFWAQEAWANYWGWDSKENSALITWLVYVVYIHLRMLGGYRGAKAMAVLVGGAASVFLTFQLFGYLPDSQKSLHRYTDDGVEAKEGMQGGAPVADEQARIDSAAEARR